MLKFNKKMVAKETIKRVVNSPYTKAAGVAISAVGTGVSIARKVAEEKQHKEQLKEVKRIERKLNRITRDLQKVSSKKEEKEFSIIGGSNEKDVPMTLEKRAMLYTADHSIYNIGQERNSKTSDLYPILSNYAEDVQYFINSNKELYNKVSILYKGQVMVLLVNYGSMSKDFDNLSEVLDRFCKTFPGASYRSDVLRSYGADYMIELYVPEGSEEILIKSLIQKGLVVNLI